MCYAFKETAVEAVHVTGAGLVFGIGVVYAAIQVHQIFISETQYPFYTN